jgi:hypothetical protein
MAILADAYTVLLGNWSLHHAIQGMHCWVKDVIYIVIYVIVYILNLTLIFFTNIK